MKSTLIKRIAVFGGLILLFAGFTANSQDVKDIDGKVYNTAKLGLQVWTASNLSVSHFRNGDVIVEAKTPEEWAAAGTNGTPAWCYYENDPRNGMKYGKLYNWYAINDPRGLAPEGWHVATNEDWRALVKNLLGIDVAGTKLKSAADWKVRKGTNNIGFTAIPGGRRDTEGKFKDLGNIGQWWSNSVPIEVRPSNKIFSFALSDAQLGVKYLQVEKGTGLSVRCEQD
ncbi:MAG: fibrobacter succinogenes major paralogous domain-containing protein [Bacteroidales bacterium]